MTTFNESLLSAIDSFGKVCGEIVGNNEIFKNFKSNPVYMGALEHVSCKQGKGYIDEINNILPSIFQTLDKFITNDKIGNPNTCYYEELKMNISPTTLRYIKVLCDLINHFGSLDNMDIVEIGCGYGGQCKIINDVFKFRSYTLIDLPEVLRLSNKYLKMFDINVILRDVKYDFNIPYDLCISNYAFTELDRETQVFYADKIIRNSTKGYFTCNFMGDRESEGAMTPEEIYKLKPNHKILPEKPLTGVSNLIYIWDF